MNLDDVERWMDGYVKAWASNDADDIASLFTEDARYFSEPSVEPWVGRESIVRKWLENRDEPGGYTFRYEPMAAVGDLAFVRGWTEYIDEPAHSYDNLWVFRLAEDGRCSEFTEWYVKRRPAS